MTKENLSCRYGWFVECNSHLSLMSFPFLHRIRNKKKQKKELQINIKIELTAFDSDWMYEYPDLDI